MADKVALVTGAGSGIGKACALALMNAGYHTVFAGRRLDRLEAAAAEGKASGQQSLCLSTDVGDPKAVAALFTTTKAAFGRLDVLFNNAGGGTPGGILFEDISYDLWQSALNANLTGAFLCSQQAFKLMKEQDPHGGRIINNGSISAHTPRPNSAPYSSNKHAITGLTKATALDGRKYDIAVGQIDIGNALTDATARMANGVLQPNGQMMPEPTMDVQDVARAVVFMAGLPLEHNVQFMTIMATKMPFVGRG